MMNKMVSCVSDRPISTNKDALGNNQYAKGLLHFISQAETPITLGIQGGWGSGKTSLINILQEQLNANSDALPLFVNAWEHSLFQNGQDKSCVAISLLSGVVDEICDVIRNNENISDKVQKEALQEDSFSQKAGKALVGLAAMATRIGAKFVADVDLPTEVAKNRINPNAPQALILNARFIRELRKNIGHAVETIIEQTRYKRFVCFVDDLDRVHPKVAVEILDVLKNIFDVPGCVFVLAIDYDVVVKGLIDKFGEKTEHNEREFRQYFDKIIQIPFSMPIGGYKDKMEELLRPLLINLGGDLSGEDVKDLSNVAFWATDGIPRGVKRIVNTVSLLKMIQCITNTEKKDDTSPLKLKVLFAVVALQIDFPELYSKILENCYFIGWKPDELRDKWKLFDNVDEIYFEEGYLDSEYIRDQYGEDFDEDWEQVLFLLCQKNSWLKHKKDRLSKLMNCLASWLGMDFRPLEEALSLAKTTNVSPDDYQEPENRNPNGVSYAELGKMTGYEIFNALETLGLSRDQLIVHISKILPSHPSHDVISKRINKKRDLTLKEIYPEYSDLENNKNGYLADKTVSFAQKYQLSEVIAIYLELSTEEVELALDNTTKQTRLKNVFGGFCS